MRWLRTKDRWRRSPAPGCGPGWPRRSGEPYRRSADRLSTSAGLVASLGIGEAPVGLQGTFSLWESSSALSEFAYGSEEHQRAIKDTRRIGWYAEELFARFAVVEARGTLRGRGIDIAP